jgi:hypothetical protein
MLFSLSKSYLKPSLTEKSMKCISVLTDLNKPLQEQKRYNHYSSESEMKPKVLITGK